MSCSGRAFVLEGGLLADLLSVPFSGGEILFAAAGKTGAEAFSGKQTISKAEDSLDEALDMVQKIAVAMSDRLSELQFESAEANLGLKITGKGKFIVAEASAEASLGFKIVFKPGG